ncbi:MAG: methyltransferase [Rhodospirillaceae bacterium]|jgi:hypothetical protein|nr:methyltransferase [Rhodospirillaceae bacterium]MBT4589038.1 methyltransferase [Rhodospirillaceae bacterium]MBT4940807.1 methyltransferase [Rhodospirillaceae bacterium]MBT5939268.1 methyltransferase [Rhodospirillaceae bacterium]MBT7955310.1 methyltransferase [Rhodospirillaceae bacterium]
MLFDYAVLAIVLLTTSLSLIYCVVTGISPVPSSRGSKKHMFALLPADFSGEIVDLGAGWGSLVYPMAQMFPECSVFAYEISPVPWLAMQLRGLFQIRRNLTIERVNMLKKSFSFRAETAAVVCYLHSEALEKLRPKLERDLKPGTLIISNVFDIPGWHPEAIHEIDDGFCPQIYVYRVP